MAENHKRLIELIRLFYCSFVIICIIELCLKNRELCNKTCILIEFDCNDSFKIEFILDCGGYKRNINVVYIIQYLKSEEMRF